MNLTKLSEKLREDVIAYFAKDTPRKVAQAHSDEVCKIIVKRVTEEQNERKEN